MAQYIYERYSVNGDRWSSRLTGNAGSGQHNIGDTITGFRVLNVNQFDGTVTTDQYVNTTFTGEYGFYLYSNVMVGSPATYLYVYHSASGSWSSQYGETYYIYPSKGSFVDTVTAEDGTYPDDGKYGSYWYVKTVLSESPVVIAPNGGETVSGLFTIEIQPIEDAIANHLQTQIDLSTDNGASWRELTTLDVGVTTYEHNFSDEVESSLCRIRVRHINQSGVYSNADESDGVFTNLHNMSPTAPTGLNPKGVTIDRSQVFRLSWNFNDPNVNDTQSKAVIQWKPKNATSWHTIQVNNSNQYYDVSANVFSEGEIVWQVKTYDQANLESAYSDQVVFTASNPTDAPTITAPNDIVPIARPTVQWSSINQAGYQLIVNDLLGATVWDSGEVNSLNKARTVGVDLTNGGQYVIWLRIKNHLGLWSAYASKNITVSYTPPAKPSVSVVASEAKILVDVTHYEPTELQPAVIKTDLYRRENNNWIRIAENIGKRYIDCTPASGQVYQYRVRAYADNDTYSESDIAEASIKLIGVWLHDPTNPDTLHQFKYDGGGRSSQWSANGALMQFAGRKLPVAEFDDTESQSINANLTLLKKDEDLSVLEQLIKSRNTLCYRDGRGRKLFCQVFSLPVVDEFYGNTVSLTFDAVSYTEEV